MTNQEIFELLSRLENSSIHSIKLTRDGFSLEVSKGAVCTETAAAISAAPAVAAAPQPQKDAAISAPLAGVFYAASEPGAQPYVTVGDRVKAGQTVCLMEAMKMISEIPAPCDCIITAVLKENAQLAAYDEPLFRIQPC